MIKRYKKLILAGLTMTLFVFSYGFAMAQSPQVEEKLNETKESVRKLIEAKDADSSLEKGLRIKTFKKVIDLSKSEAKDLKVSLLSLNLESKILKEWRENSIEKLEKAVEYYDQKKKELDKKGDDLSIEEIKSLAEEFRKWRKENYSRVREEIKQFLMIEKEENIIKTAKNRWKKVQGDVKLLEKSGFSTQKLKQLLKESNEFIESSEKKKEKAMDIFIQKIKQKQTTSTKATSTQKSTSTNTLKNSTSSNTNVTTTKKMESSATSSKNKKISTSTRDKNKRSSSSVEAQQKNGKIQASTSTNSTTTEKLDKSKKNSTTTKENGSGQSNIKKMDSRNNSIKNLVGSSIKDVKGAYQVFIEMSSLVRKLLS